MVASRREMTRSRQHQGAAAAGVAQQRDHPDVGDRPGGLDLGLDRAPAGHGLGDHDGGPVGERLAERQGVGPHAPERRGRVGAGELDPAAGVEHDQAVADPGRGGRVVGLHEREGPDGHHLQQGLGRPQVGRLKPAGGAGRGLGRLDAEHGHDLALVAHGHGVDPDRLGVDQDRLHRALAPALPPGPLHVRVPGRLDHLADQVHRVEGAGGVGPELPDDAEALAAVHRQEQQQVSEGEVGDELPARHQAVEVLDGVVGQAPHRRGNVGHQASVLPHSPGLLMGTTQNWGRSHKRTGSMMATESARDGMRGGIQGGAPLVVVRVPPDEGRSRKGQCYADGWPPRPWR
jgi:hypothetical protein